MVILKVGRDNPIAHYARIRRKLYSRDQLKQKYRFACKYECYLLARTYLYALYGRKGYFYDYERCRGKLYAYEYPPIRA
jgi:hypothetical protein